jgi:hypothetical protein
MLLCYRPTLAGSNVMKRIVLAAILSTCAICPALAQPDWQAVESALGRKGVAQADMLKLTFPRADLKVVVGEVTVEPALALTSWIGFRAMGKQAMAMGDLVLLEKEVSPVMAALLDGGIVITALHNHLIGTSPAVFYLHFGGNGDPVKLAVVLHSALALTGTPLEAQPPAVSPATVIDWSRVEAVFASTGQKKGDMLQFGFPRKEPVGEDGMEIPPYLGTATAINLQKVGDKAATTGDFVLTADEVNPVIKALTSHNLSVTALHSHMLTESPRLFFLHFWGVGEPEKLAVGLKAALDKTAIRK